MAKRMLIFCSNRHPASGSRALRNLTADHLFSRKILIHDVDILLDFDTRTVTKFVLHTNLIGHYDFGEYTRPSFEIKCTARQGPFSSETLTINTNSKLENFRAAFTDESGSCNPVVVNRTSANDGENPFGSTFCYGNDQIIVEVMDNSYIATLTLYGSNSQESSGSEDQNEDGDDIY